MQNLGCIYVIAQCVAHGMTKGTAEETRTEFASQSRPQDARLDRLNKRIVHHPVALRTEGNRAQISKNPLPLAIADSHRQLSKYCCRSADTRGKTCIPGTCKGINAAR